MLSNSPYLSQYIQYTHIQYDIYYRRSSPRVNVRVSAYIEGVLVSILDSILDNSNNTCLYFCTCPLPSPSCEHNRLVIDIATVCSQRGLVSHECSIRLHLSIFSLVLDAESHYKQTELELLLPRCQYIYIYIYRHRALIVVLAS